jgi:hypothetical protein
MDVDKDTYRPSLFEPPIPVPSITEELTPKYKMDREWHEDHYVRMKVLEDARSKWYEQRKVQSPAEEAAEKRREQAELRAKQLKSAGPSESTMQLIAKQRALKGLGPKFSNGRQIL